MLAEEGDVVLSNRGDLFLVRYCSTVLLWYTRYARDIASYFSACWSRFILLLGQK